MRGGARRSHARRTSCTLERAGRGRQRSRWALFGSLTGSGRGGRSRSRLSALIPHPVTLAASRAGRRVLAKYTGTPVTPSSLTRGSPATGRHAKVMLRIAAFIAVRVAQRRIPVRCRPRRYGSGTTSSAVSSRISPHQGLRRLLSRLHDPARQPPLAVVAPPLQQHLARRVEDDRGDARLQDDVVADLGAQIAHVRLRWAWREFRPGRAATCGCPRNAPRRSRRGCAGTPRRWRRPSG